MYQVCMYGIVITYCMVTHTRYSKSMDKPGKFANPPRGQLNRKINVSLSAFAPENLVSRDGFGSPVPRQPPNLHAQAESGAYLRYFSRVPRRRPFIYYTVTVADWGMTACVWSDSKQPIIPIDD